MFINQKRKNISNSVCSIRVFVINFVFIVGLSYSVLLFIRLIPNIEEIDFEHNYIGDATGREILHAMQQRRGGNYHHYAYL